LLLRVLLAEDMCGVASTSIDLYFKNIPLSLYHSVRFIFLSASLSFSPSPTLSLSPSGRPRGGGFAWGRPLKSPFITIIIIGCGHTARCPRPLPQGAAISAARPRPLL